eukprot:gnl/TRDRNA2_/TRDRNA2_184449_c0_seq1.p1 gnl/TRDRNA2_/TRDRNA2_184449_c0~~gnl/TRDRNA2_/TRDRNA2_184449_c0_seq1.p1  ORF type:complete len:521 (-),score=179.70 gnl/TRDRNA2_/TRDRNA2_184449_c0_seq1:50-1558(-)
MAPPEEAASKAMQPRTSIIAAAQKLEGEVADLRAEAETLRNEQERWGELKKTGVPKKKTAAADFAREMCGQTLLQERKLRDAEHRSFAEQKALEQTERACAERTRRAEEAARRVEERAAAAERALAERVQGFEAARAEAEKNHKMAMVSVQCVLQEAKDDAEARVKAREADLQHECQRAEAQVAQEREKMLRKQVIAQAHAEELCRKAQYQADYAEAMALNAEKKRDTEAAAAARRSERSSEAAASKVSLAQQSHDQVVEQTSLHLQQAREEGERKLEAAKALEEAALEDRERRKAQAFAQIVTAEKELAVNITACEEIENEQRSRVEAARSDLAAKIVAWTAVADEAEKASRVKVEEVRALADQLMSVLQEEVRLSEGRVKAEADAARLRVEEQEKVLDGSLKKQRAQTTAALTVADGRVASAKALAERQLSEVEARGALAVEQKAAEVASLQEVVDGRLKQAASLLKTYLDDTDIKAELELVNGGATSMLLPGCPDETAN